MQEMGLQVKNIVDKAKKEMGIEKVLQEMRATWSTVEFQFERHHSTGIAMLVSDEELIETLEDNQVRYVWTDMAHFTLFCSMLFGFTGTTTHRFLMRVADAQSTAESESFSREIAIVSPERYV